MWNRANHLNDFTANVLRNSRAAQHRRAILPSGKVVEFCAPISDRAAEPDCAEIILRQTVAVWDNRDPRGLGY